MTTKPLLLLVALTLCCCITSLQAVHWCKCLHISSAFVRRSVIEKIEVYPISGSCRKTQVIVYRKNGSKVCVNPNKPWVKSLLNEQQQGTANVNSTTVSPPASATKY